MSNIYQWCLTLKIIVIRCVLAITLTLKCKRSLGNCIGFKLQCVVRILIGEMLSCFQTHSGAVCVRIQMSDWVSPDIKWTLPHQLTVSEWAFPIGQTVQRYAGNHGKYLPHFSPSGNWGSNALLLIMWLALMCMCERTMWHIWKLLYCGGVLMYLGKSVSQNRTDISTC